MRSVITAASRRCPAAPRGHLTLIAVNPIAIAARITLSSRGCRLLEQGQRHAKVPAIARPRVSDERDRRQLWPPVLCLPQVCRLDAAAPRRNGEVRRKPVKSG